MGGSRGGQGVRTPPPPENSQKYSFFSNTGPDPLKNHKATNKKQAIIQYWAVICPPFKWRFAGWPMMAN